MMTFTIHCKIGCKNVVSQCILTVRTALSVLLQPLDIARKVNFIADFYLIGTPPSIVGLFKRFLLACLISCFLPSLRSN